MRWYMMPIEDLPSEEYRERAFRFHRTALALSDPNVAERFEAMALDAEVIADRKAREEVLQVAHLGRRFG